MSETTTTEMPPLIGHEGERKVATVLFADVVDSSRLVAGMDPEDADERLLAALQVMTDAVRCHGGTVNQVLGDGIMALFGVPQAREDHALRACLAADAMHRTLLDMATELTAPRDEAIMLRVGVATGEIVAKPPQADFDLAYRVVGEAVYLARRLQESAPSGATLLSPATGDLARASIHAEVVGAVGLKAGATPIEALRLDGIEADRRRYRGVDASHGRCFVGRSNQLDGLAAALSEVRSGSGGSLVVTGEAGVGKSRLVTEFLSGAPAGDCRIVRCDLLPHGLARPLEPTAQLIRALVGASDSGADPVGADELKAAFRGLGIDDSVSLSALLDTAGIRVSEPDWIAMEASERLYAAGESLCRLVRTLGQTSTLIVVVEDYHWVDSKMRSVMNALADCIGRAPVLLLATCRSGRETRWSGWPGVREVALDPLSRRDSSALLDSLLGVRPELDELKHDLAGRAQGNPFFLEECVRALEGLGSFAGPPGDYRLAVPVADLRPPATVQGALAERIDGLDARDRAVLLSASVIGLCVDVALLCDLTGRARADLQDALDRLQSGGFLERTRIIPNLEYSFRHVLTHEVAYDTLLKRRRPVLHARVASAVRTRTAEQLPGKAELLAYHFFRAEDWPMAFACGRRAGQRALARSANREAADHFAAASDAFRKMPRALRKPRREFDIRLDLAQACFLLSREAGVRTHLGRAGTLADSCVDERRGIKVLSLMGLFHWYNGDMDRAVEAAQLALNQARIKGDSELVSSCMFRFCGISLDAGDYSGACDLLAKATSRNRSNLHFKRSGLLTDLPTAAFATLSRGLAELGQFAKARATADRAVSFADASGHAFSQIYSRLLAGYVLLRRGEFESSVPILSQSLELCTAKRVQSVHGLNAVALGFAEVCSGQRDRGLEYIERGMNNLSQQTLILRPALQLCWIGEAYLLAGNEREARAHATEALSLAVKHGEHGHEAWALWLLGSIGLVDADMAEVELCFARSSALAVARGMAPLSAHCRIGLARHFMARGERDKSMAEWHAGSATYRDLGMSGWLARARRELPDLVESRESIAVV